MGVGGCAPFTKQNSLSINLNFCGLLLFVSLCKMRRKDGGKISQINLVKKCHIKIYSISIFSNTKPQSYIIIHFHN